MIGVKLTEAAATVIMIVNVRTGGDATGLGAKNGVDAGGAGADRTPAAVSGRVSGSSPRP